MYGELLLLHPSSPHGPVYTPYVPPLQAPTATARARDPPEISRNPPELACLAGECRRGKYWYQ